MIQGKAGLPDAGVAVGKYIKKYTALYILSDVHLHPDDLIKTTF